MTSDNVGQSDPLESGVEPDETHSPEPDLDPVGDDAATQGDSAPGGDADVVVDVPQGLEGFADNAPGVSGEDLQWYEYEPIDVDDEQEEAVDPGPGTAIRVVRGFGWGLIWLGMLTLGFVAHQLWITTFFAQQNQNNLAEQRIELMELADIQEVEHTTPDGRTGTILTEEPVPEGYPGMRIRIPTIDRLVEGWEVVEGVGVADLRNGAGHMPDTPLPGQPGNSVISGHRTTYGQPFHELDQLEPGDLIEVDTATGTHVYAMRESIIVRPTDVWVTEPRDGAWLTLTTCHPKFSAAQRLIIFAELVGGPNADLIGASP